MSGLARVIDEVAEKIIERIESSFQELSGEVRKLIENERGETLKIVDEMVEQADKRSEMIKSRVLSLSQVKIRGRKLEQLEECVDEVIKEVLKVVREKASRGELDEYLEKMLEEAVDIVNARKVKAYTNTLLREKLKKFSEKVLSERGIEVTIQEEPVETVFGVIVKSIDDLVSYDNTVEARLEKMKPQIRKAVATLIS
ncbi:MAG: V-type ATP synthase subunit E family protein [Nitrososphaerota archaeon]